VVSQSMAITCPAAATSQRCLFWAIDSRGDGLSRCPLRPALPVHPARSLPSRIARPRSGLCSNSVYSRVFTDALQSFRFSLLCLAWSGVIKACASTAIACRPRYALGSWYI
jgi:hypothetical protein